LREHLIVRLFVVCGLRAQELFVLGVDDVEPGILRIDEALKKSEKGSDRIGETKSISKSLRSGRSSLISLARDDRIALIVAQLREGLGAPPHNGGGRILGGG
jgi:hypothetical protein